jgi:steroid delta-isomerase-like uncharacterized protein
MLYETKPFTAAAYIKFWVDGLNRGDVSIAESVFHDDCIIHINGGPHKDLSLSEFKDMVQGMIDAFPDLHFTIEEQVKDGDKVCIRWTATGTHTKPLGEIPPTGKTVNVEGFLIDHMKDDKVAERWELWDQAAMLQQLGVI